MPMFEEELHHISGLDRKALIGALATMAQREEMALENCQNADYVMEARERIDRLDRILFFLRYRGNVETVVETDLPMCKAWEDRFFAEGQWSEDYPD